MKTLLIRKFFQTTPAANASGFSLVEVIIAGGLLAATAMAGAQVFNASLTAKRRLETNNGKRILGDDVRQSLREIQTCSSNLVGMRADIETNDVQLYRLQPSATPGVFEKALTPFLERSPAGASRTDSLTINSVKLAPYAFLSPTTRLMDITVQEQSPQAVGGKISEDHVIVQVTTDATGKFIQECVGVDGDVRDMSTNQMACELTANGTPSDFYYDTVKQSCEYKYFSGTRAGNETDANCNAGETPISCTIITPTTRGPNDGPIPGFLDTSVEPGLSIYEAAKTLHYIYPNGVQTEAWYVDDIWQCSLTSTGCHCNWLIPQLMTHRQTGVVCTGEHAPTGNI